MRGGKRARRERGGREEAGERLDPGGVNPAGAREGGVPERRWQVGGFGMVWMKEGGFPGREPGGSPESLSVQDLKALFLDWQRQTQEMQTWNSGLDRVALNAATLWNHVGQGFCFIMQRDLILFCLNPTPQTRLWSLTQRPINWLS